jgi:hypothetical protein
MERSGAGSSATLSVVARKVGSVTPRARLERLMLEYFRRREGTRIQAEDLATFVVDLDDSGRLAFGATPLHITIGGSVFGDDVEPLTATHAHLAVVRNDLSSGAYGDPKVADLVAVSQLLDTNGELQPPGLVFEGAVPEVGYLSRQSDYDLVYGLFFRVVYESDERSDNIVPVFYDVSARAEAREVAKCFDLLTLRSGLPTGRPTEDEKKSAPPIVAHARGIIEAKVRSDAANLANSIAVRLEADRVRVEKHYTDELAGVSDRDAGRKEKLVALCKKDLDELSDKYSLRVMIRLQSLVRLWLPVVKYRLLAKGKRRSREFLEITYRPDFVRARHAVCPHCHNEERYVICLVGGHLACGPCAGPAVDCGVCGDPTCKLHRRVCSVGGEILCASHEDDPCERHCEECGVSICISHGIATVEKTLVCPQHAKTSTCCGRQFGASHVVGCVSDPTESLCTSHRHSCAGCGQPVCQTHSALLVDSPKRRVCRKCRGMCADCGNGLAYLSSDLRACSFCDRILCANHRASCVACGRVVDKAHARQTTIGVLCPMDAATCSQCPNGTYHLKSDLRGCTACKRPFCLAHVTVCYVCGRHVCEHDLRLGIGGQVLCPSDAGSCQQCPAGRYHLKSDLRSCSFCKRFLCMAHLAVCSVCGRDVCEHDLRPGPGGQVLCPGDAGSCQQCPDGRYHLKSDLRSCSRCEGSFCPIHLAACSVCHREICEHDRRLSATGAVLCLEDAVECSRCPTTKRVHPRPAVRPCVRCGAVTCEAHGIACPLCARSWICGAHEEDAKCAGCGRPACGASGCTVDAVQCPGCTIFYCAQCAKPGEPCKYCAHVTPIVVTDQWLAFLAGAATHGDDIAKAWIKAALKSPEGLRLVGTRNYRYGLLEWQDEGRLSKLRSVFAGRTRLRLIYETKGQIVLVRRETVD